MYYNITIECNRKVFSLPALIRPRYTPVRRWGSVWFSAGCPRTPGNAPTCAPAVSPYHEAQTPTPHAETHASRKNWWPVCFILDLYFSLSLSLSLTQCLSVSVFGWRIQSQMGGDHLHLREPLTKDRKRPYNWFCFLTQFFTTTYWDEWSI